MYIYIVDAWDKFLTPGVHEHMMHYEDARKSMVRDLKANGYITSPEVEKAMLKVPRHEFMPTSEDPYVDRPQSIGSGQTISAPHMVALMVEYLDLREGHRVLEVGGGMGYHAAVIAELVGDTGVVYSVELVESLARSASTRLKRAGYNNVKVIVADGSRGYPREAPYHRISVACAAPDVPEKLIEQLVPGGKLLIPVGRNYYQELNLITKVDEEKVERKGLGGVIFVPLKGEYGF